MEELPEEPLERAQGDISKADSNTTCVESLKSSMEHSNSSDVLEENMNDTDDCANDDTVGDTEVEASNEMDASSVVLAEDKTIASEQSPACSERSPTDDSANEFDTESTNVDKSTLDTENARPEETIVNNGDANVDSPTSSPVSGDGEQELLNGDNRSDAIEPDERIEESPAGGGATDSKRFNSSDEGDFLGFDSATIETSLGKTSEFLQSLQSKETVLARANEPEDTHAASTSSAIPETSVNAVPNMIDNADLSNHVGPQLDESQPDTTTAQAQMKNSRKPNSAQTVYGLPVNIFDETLPSGSKRVKKKRKFFDDFDESENEKASRKSSLSRPNEEGVKLLNASGENKENFISDEKMKTESVPENDTAGQNKAKRAYSFDISNPLFKEPFKHGWKREICYRHLPEGSKSKPAYVSYYSPAGKKLKTIRQIVDGLPTDSELGTQHFTFSVQRIFNEPSEFEILKDAKSRADLNDSDTVNNDSMDTTPTAHLAAQTTPPDPGKFVSRKKLPTSGTRLVIKKPKYLKQADSEDDGSDTTLLLQSAPSSVTPKIVIKGASLNSTKTNAAKPKSTSILKKDRKSVGKKQEKSSKKSSLSAESVHGSMREYANSSDAASISKNTDDRRICSFSCPLALGSVPTLQCTACLGLYHFECCDIDASLTLHSYVCKSCRSRVDVQSKLLLAVSEPSSSSTLGYGGSNAVTAGARSVAKNTKIVDGVTTWLPPSSNVQLSSRHTTAPLATLDTPQTTQTTLLQSVLELDGKRFIIVPKESIVSISPNTSSTVNTYSGSFDHRHNDTAQPLSIDPTVRATLSAIHAESARNYMNNSPPDINSAGVLLVPVIPSGNDPFCSETERRKRKLSDDASGIPAAKVAKLEGDRMVRAYRSALTLSNVAQLYNPLTACFKYLTVRDLLRVSMSCKYLNRIASERNLWTTVRLKNSKVRDWDGFARTLRKYATKKLDLRKMLCPSTPEDVNAMWNAFLEKITTVTSLEHIEFSRCNAQVVETVARTCPNLVVINAVQLRNGDGLSIESFARLENLRELRLKGLNGLKIETGAEELRFHSEEVMRVLSLTSIKNLNLATVRAIGALSHVHSLELGECNGALVDELAVSISKLSNLRRLRLEQITNLDPHFKLFESLRSLPLLKSLELINIEVKMGFCEAIASCTNIENLVIFPLYKTESATSNRLIMDSLLSLSESLKSFVWGLTHELIRATDFYANKFIEKPTNGNEESNVPPKKGLDSIPIVKRISKQPEVDILSVRNLEKMLAATLPQSHVKVITVANALAWRQN